MMVVHGNPHVFVMFKQGTYIVNTLPCFVITNVLLVGTFRVVFFTGVVPEEAAASRVQRRQVRMFGVKNRSSSVAS